MYFIQLKLFRENRPEISPWFIWLNKKYIYSFEEIVKADGNCTCMQVYAPKTKTVEKMYTKEPISDLAIRLERGPAELPKFIIF